MSRRSTSHKQMQAGIEIVAQREEPAAAQDPGDSSTSQSRQLVSLMHRLAPRRFDRTREMIFRLDGFVEIFNALRPLEETEQMQDCNDFSVDIKS